MRHGNLCSAANARTRLSPSDDCHACSDLRGPAATAAHGKKADPDVIQEWEKAVDEMALDCGLEHYGSLDVFSDEDEAGVLNKVYTNGTRARHT